jgi:hypothetical protein
VQYAGKGNQVHCNVSISDYLTMLHSKDEDNISARKG